MRIIQKRITKKSITGSAIVLLLLSACSSELSEASIDRVDDAQKTQCRIDGIYNKCPIKKGLSCEAKMNEKNLLVVEIGDGDADDICVYPAPESAPSASRSKRKTPPARLK